MNKIELSDYGIITIPYINIFGHHNYPISELKFSRVRIEQTEKFGTWLTVTISQVNISFRLVFTESKNFSIIFHMSLIPKIHALLKQEKKRGKSFTLNYLSNSYTFHYSALAELMEKMIGEEMEKGAEHDR